MIACLRSRLEMAFFTGTASIVLDDMAAARQSQCRADRRHPLECMACVVVAANLQLICPQRRVWRASFEPSGRRFMFVASLPAPADPATHLQACLTSRAAELRPCIIYSLHLVIMLSARLPNVSCKPVWCGMQWDNCGQPIAANADGATARQNPAMMSLEHHRRTCSTHCIR